MLLATYQPNKESLDLIDEKSYHIWCFSAETFEDFILGSITALPNFAETLIFFEAENPTPIDLIAWSKSDMTEGVDYRDYMTTSDKPVFYRVDEIPEESIVFDLYDLPDVSRDGDPQFIELLNAIYLPSKQAYYEISRLYDTGDANIVIDGENTAATKGSIEWKMGKSLLTMYGFVGTLSPIYYNMMYSQLKGEKLYTTTHENDWGLATSIAYISRLITTNILEELDEYLALVNQELTIDSYNNFKTKLFKKIKTKPLEIYTELGHSVKRNDKCPCGSNKKTKVCHMKQ